MNLGLKRLKGSIWPSASRSAAPRQSAAGGSGVFAFTLVEVMIAITILALIIIAIYSTWTAILRASKTGKDVAAAVQRARITVRVLEDSLSSARSFIANQVYYGFLAENGDDATLSFVARLAKSFPRSGKFGDLDVRRVTFSVESGRDGTRQLVMRQVPLGMEPDIDEREHPVVLAKNVTRFAMQFWDNRLNDWVEDWKQTNQVPRLVMFDLKIASNPNAPGSEEEISRVISIPAMAVQPVWQSPRLLGAPGTQPPGVVPPGTTPGVVPGTGVPPGSPPGAMQPGGAALPPQ